MKVAFFGISVTVAPFSELASIWVGSSVREGPGATVAVAALVSSSVLPRPSWKDTFTFTFLPWSAATST